MTAFLFLGLVLLVFRLVAAASARYLPRETAALVTPVLSVWLILVGAVSAAGLVRGGGGGPPGILLVAGPVALFLVLVAWSGGALRLASRLPVWVLIGAQAYRVGVELALHQLWLEGLVPRMMTYAGANVDIWVGGSAPLAAWLALQGRPGRVLALAWNGVGLLALGNVVARSVLTAPGPLHLLATEVPNLAVGTFPYTYIAGFLAPLAAALHVLCIRVLLRSPAAARAEAGTSA